MGQGSNRARCRKNETLKRQLFYYTTCPKYAKAYGKNYVVLLAKV